MNFDVDLVGKIGSMALIDKENSIINYNQIARVSKFLKPGVIWVSSGATEIGRLDYIKRNGKELDGNMQDNKTDYAAQGQAILMSSYREFVEPKYSVRQVLVEHVHFNDEEKKEHLRSMLVRCKSQNAIPIINYNDAVCSKENMKMEIQALLSKRSKVVECLDNDETATQIACLVKSKILLILTSVDGIYTDVKDKNSLVKEISGKDAYEVIENIDNFKKYCHGASRPGANGALYKLEYIKDAVKNGTQVVIANACYDIADVLSGKANSTKIGVR